MSHPAATNGNDDERVLSELQYVTWLQYTENDCRLFGFQVRDL